MGLLNRGTVPAWSSEEFIKKSGFFLPGAFVRKLLCTNTWLVGEEVPDLQTTGGWGNIPENPHCC